MYSLLNIIRNLWRRRQRFYLDTFSRSLPFAETLVDRWEKARLLGFGSGSSVYDSSLIFGRVDVGVNTWIGPFTILDGTGGLTIGDHCEISAGVQIYTHESALRTTSKGEAAITTGETRIGSHCYIGPNAIISKGVVLGDRCIIGANSLVNRSFPPGSKAWGTPARLIQHDTPI